MSNSATNAGSDAEDNTRGDTEAHSAPEADTARRRILLVEDERLVALSQKQTIERHGFDVTTSHTADEALHKAVQDPDIGLVLMDMDLDDGVGGTRAAEQILEHRDLPIVFLTGHSEKEYVERAKRITRYGYVLKSSGELMLIQAINMALELFRAHREAREERQRFRYVFDYSQQAKVIYDAENDGQDFVIVDLNRTAQEVEDVDAPEVIGKRVTEVFPGVRDFGLLGVLRHVWRSGEPQRFPNAYYHDGRRSGWRDNFVYKLPSGEVVASYQDTTESNRLGHSLDYAYRIINGSPVVAFVWQNARGWPVEFVSPNVERILGYTPEELQSGEIRYEDIIHPDDRDRVIAEVRQHTAQLPPTSFQHRPYRLVTKCGELRWVDDRTNIRTDADGNVLRFEGVVLDITQQALLSERVRLQARALQAVDQAVIATDLEGNITSWNSFAEELFGWKEREVLGRNIQDVTVPDASRDQSEEIMQHLSRGEAWSGEFTVQDKSGRRFPAVVTDAPVYDDSGNLIGIVGVSRDVTEQKEKERRIRESELRWKSLFEQATVGIILADGEHRVIDANPYASELLGYSGEELQKLTARDLIHPEDLAAQSTEQNLAAMRQGTSPVTVERRFRKKDGSYIHALVTMKPLDTFGEKVSHMLMFHDVTERKNAELALVEREKNFSSLVENATDIIVRLDTQLRHIYCNKAVETQWGIARAELLGKTPREVTPDQHKGAETERVFKAAFDTRQEQRAEQDGETTAGRKWFEARVVPELNDSGEPESLLIVIRDVTERKETERKLEDALREKESLMKELNHRVKNNLNMISSLVNLEDAALGDEVDLSDIKGRINAIQMVHQKLYQTGEVASVGFRGYVQGLLSTIFSSFTERRVTIDNRIGDIAISTRKAVPLGLIINEIATNAIKYGFTSGEEPRFTVAMEEEAGTNSLVLTVSNTGSPFPEEIGFHNAGTLGLQLIAGLTQQVGGTVELQKRPHPVYTFRIPMDGKRS